MHKESGIETEECSEGGRNVALLKTEIGFKSKELISEM